MRNILGPGGIDELTDLVREYPLVVFDFDGTLAPIVDAQEWAALRPTTRTLLGIAGLEYPCAVVSERRRADVLRRLEGVPLVAVLGNHGAEAGVGPVERRWRPRVEGWLASLHVSLRPVPGVRLEDRGLSIAVHYGRCPDRARARRAILAAADRLAGVRAFGENGVVNVVSDEAHDKADAVAVLLRRAGRRIAIYVGDDATDEAAFRHPCVALGIRIGRTRRTAAGGYVPSQAHVDALLRALVRARRRADGLADDLAFLERSIGEQEARARWRAG